MVEKSIMEERFIRDSMFTACESDLGVTQKSGVHSVLRFFVSSDN